MASRKEIEDQIAKLQADLAQADEDGYECWVKDDKGRETKIGGQHAKKWLARLGVLDEDTDEDTDETAEPPQEPEIKPKREKYFG